MPRRTRRALQLLYDMKILYAIQGTGNGHISRARDIVPLLQEKGELDLLISGTEADVSLGYPVKFIMKGLSFVFGKDGGVDLMATYKKAKTKRFYKELRSLDVHQYDIVISDFEPVSAWACRLQGKRCYALSHQSAVLNKKAPVPNSLDLVGRWILKNYAPTDVRFGFHFAPYDENIYTPLIRKEIRDAVVSRSGHYTVYLPSYSDKKILRILGALKDVEWQVYSKHTKNAYKKDHVSVFPISNRSFVESMVSSEGIICGAGFEAPAEALFLGKKLIVVPMKNQYEQQCNATSLAQLGVPILKKINVSAIKKIHAWLDSDQRIIVDFPNCTAAIIDELFQIHERSSGEDLQTRNHGVQSLKQLRKILFRNTPVQND